jgi:hypothetical protein
MRPNEDNSIFFFALLALLAATALASCEGSAHAEAPAPIAPIESSVPASETGAIMRRGPLRPAATPARWKACSFRHPICVHSTVASAGTSGPGLAVLDVLGATERAWDLATGPLALPAPEADLATRAYDVYIIEPAPAVGAPPSVLTETALGERDPRAAFDRASAFTLLDRRTAVAGCALDATMARELTRAILYGVAPGTDEPVARAQTTYLAKLMVPCAIGDAGDIGVFQAHPDHAIMDPWEESDPSVGRAYARGASLFWWWLDDAFGARPGAIVRATWALQPTSTALGAWRWNAEPDAFDVLRITFKDALTTGSTLDDLLLEFAIARWLVGRAADDLHTPETRTLGDASPRLDWDIDWPAQPRRLAAREPTAPTGSAYLRVRRAGAAKGSRLRVETTWEEHAKMRWAVVKLDAQGHEKARVVIPVAHEKVTDAQITVVDLDDSDSVLIVGVNAGDPAFQVDPDDVVWEPHGWIVSLASAL